MTQDSNQPSQLSPLKQAYLALEKMQAKLEALEKAKREPIAVIGMGCRFPGGGDNPEAYWQALLDGVDAVTEIPADRWDTAAYFDADPNVPGKMSVRYGSFLKQVDGFDPQFFGISPREAAGMDPQQRLLLEVAWEALEDAGQAPDQLSGSRTGVFVGMTTGDYNQLFMNAGDLSMLDAYYASGVAHSIASGRISYVLGLQGPSLTLDTACSSSLVSVHLAVQSLRAKECNMALAGGVNLMLAPENYIALSKYGMLAPDGHCKTFDAAADGFVRGEGCGMVVLKRLSDAVADGDHVLAIIRGSAVDQDGPSSGLTAPNGPAQEMVIQEALANGGVEPGQVSYIEAHGTGTSLGDPIEVQALAHALRGGKLAQQPLVVSSVKTNVGHLEGAAGIAGFIKLVLMAQHRQIPRHLHLSKPNPFINWEKIPVVIPNEPMAWEDVDGKWIGGVSSFGFSGTNAHVVVEATPASLAEPLAEVPERPLHILSLAARSEKALRELAGLYDQYLRLNTDKRLADVAYTANVARAAFDYRMTVVASTAEQISAKLTAFASGHDAEVVSGQVQRSDKPKIAFLFTGQGSQYVQMGRGLYETQPTFRAALDECAKILEAYLEQPLLSVLFPAEGETSPLDNTTYTQPALFALEYALAQLWRSWGVEPSMVMGHSVGEYVAACLAGVFSLEDGLKLIAARARLMGKLPAGGAMVSVFATEDRVRQAIAGYKDVSIGAVNGPDSIVISGAEGSVQAIVDKLKAEGVKAKRLVVSHAFHSPLMEPILDEFEKIVSTVKLSPPRLRLMSNLTGKLAGTEITTPQYWRQHVREGVQFDSSIKAIHQLGYEVFLEIGPGATLLGMGQRSVEGVENTGLWLPSLRSGKDDWAQILDTLGKLYIAGVKPDWKGFDRDYVRQKLSLPTYPFQRTRYWLAEPKKKLLPQSAASKRLHPLLGYRLRSAMKTAQFESQLALEDYSFLNDHRIYGTALLPATGYIELATAAAKALYGNSGHTLQDLVIHDALVVGDEPRFTQLIVSPEGHFQYFSQQDGDEDWKLHAAGTLVAGQTAASGNLQLGDIQARLTENIPAETHYQRLRDNGLDFGLSLHGVVQLWRQDGEALGEIVLPKHIFSEASNYNIHPALLDACLQIIAWALPAGEDVYLPLSLNDFKLYRQPATQLWSYVQATGSSEIINADLKIVDIDGQLVAELSGLSLKRASADVLRNLAPSNYDEWLYEIGWKPAPLNAQAAEFIPAPTELVAQTAQRAEELADQYGLRTYLDGLLPELEQLTIEYVIQALYQLGWKPKVGEKFTSAALASRLKVVKQQQRLFGRLLEMLAEVNILRSAGNEWQVNSVPSAGNPQLHWEVLWEEYPTYDAELTLAKRCGDELAHALNGQADPSELLFWDGGATAGRMYSVSPAAQVYSGLFAEVVKKAVADLPADRNIRILEIGGGTGGTTSHVLPELPADRTDYTFTDIGALFIAKAPKKFSAYPFVRYQTLNIEEDPAGQGLAGQQFDLIVAANVIHATADLSKTLAHVRQLLAPSGTFIMLEVTHKERWIDLTFGLTDGWWRFVDSDVRPDYVLLEEAQWLNVLHKAGFTEASAVPEGQSGIAEQAVIIARGPSEAASDQAGDWLIFADADGIAENLAVQLRSRGQQVWMVSPGTEYGVLSAEAWQINPAKLDDYQRVLGEKPTWKGVIYLWGAGVHLPDNTLIEKLDSFEEFITGSALHLVKAAATSPQPTRLYWVTLDAVGGLSSGASNIVQSPLWGLGRTVALEHPELRTTRIDLSPNDRSGDLLLNEVLANNDEDQIIFRNGSRYVARLTQAVEAASSGDVWQLQITQRGTLDNLQIRTVERRQPGAGEIEIRVFATGLNFKDVMNTLGMYPGDPGPLGGECAGVVSAVGEGVTDLHVGDAVMGLAGGSFASYTIAPAALTVLKPDTLSFEEAAGFMIPFITAYYTLYHLGHLTTGESILIHAAAGGVGTAAVQLSQRAGAQIYATAGSAEKHAFLHSLGIEHVMSSRSLEFADEIMRLTNGRGVDMVLNSLAGDFIPKSLAVLAENGRFLEIGKSGLLNESQAAALGRGIQYHIVDWTPDTRDNPQLIRQIMLDLAQGLADGSLRPLPLQVFPSQDAVEAFRYMAQAKHIGKIIVSQGRPNTWDGAIHADATYLITGGLRGLGLLVAQWLVEKGARNLALMGRNAPGEAALETIRSLEAAGVRVAVYQGDVSREADVGRVIESVGQEMPTLRGVIHSAGVLDDGALLNQEWSRFQTVMGPKVNGAWYLHHHTLGTALDFFVLFSSVASLLGSSGQGNHAAANAFEDALAFHRRELGLPGLSINWGAWSEIGAAADRNVAARVSEQGVRTISPDDGLHILDQLLCGEAPQVGVMPINWSMFMTQFGGHKPPFLSDMVVKAERQPEAFAAAQSVASQPEILAQLEGAKPVKQRSLLTSYVQTHASKVLGLESAKAVSERTPLSELGLDSLMAVELRNLLGAGLALKRPLPATLVFDYPTVEAIANYLAHDVLKLNGDEPVAAEAPVAKPEDAGAVLESIEDMSDEEVDRLLKERMKSKK